MDHTGQGRLGIPRERVERLAFAQLLTCCRKNKAYHFQIRSILALKSVDSKITFEFVYMDG